MNRPLIIVVHCIERYPINIHTEAGQVAFLYSCYILVQEAIQSATGLEPSVKAAGNAADMKAGKMDAARADVDAQGDVLSAVTQLLNQSQEVGDVSVIQ